MSKDKDNKIEGTTKPKFIGIVVPDEGITLGAKKRLHYKKGDAFATDNESQYQNLIKQQKIK